MPGGRIGRPSGGGLRPGTSSGGQGTGINPLSGLAGLGLLGMLFRSSKRKTGSKTKQTGITVTSPKGGENWVVGSTQTIAWTSAGLSGDVKIELSRDGGTAWVTIVETAPGTGSKMWKVMEPVSTQARIRVSSVQTPNVSGASAADFTISAA